MGEDEIVRLFNAKIKLERKQYKKRVLQLADRKSTRLNSSHRN